MLSVNQKKCDLCGKCVQVCPFGAMEIRDSRVEIGAACRMCRICLKNCPNHAILFTDGVRKKADRDRWKGILVFVECEGKQIHPVTLELIGKAKELASKIHHPVFSVFIGHDIGEKARELPEYGVDKVFVYDDVRFAYYREDLYANAVEDCIKQSRPSVVLIGATSVGRSLAPRLSTRFRTGLTADCTVLDIKENSDLVQIRPAFGGNIMAQIVTEHSRPQFATVRYKVMEKAHRIMHQRNETSEDPFSEDLLSRDPFSETAERLEIRSLPENRMKSDIEVLEVIPKEKEESISEAEVIVAGGRGLKDKKDLVMLEELAALLGGRTAVSRPLVEAGWAPYTKQIGLSGRTVKPRLILTCGISGAVQFTSCMNTSQCIIAINKDPNAPIFETAHYGMVGDLYEIVPRLCEKIKKGRMPDAL